MTNIELDALNGLEKRISGLKEHLKNVLIASGKNKNKEDNYRKVNVVFFNEGYKSSVELIDTYFNYREFLTIYILRLKHDIETLEKQFADYPVKGGLK